MTDLSQNVLLSQMKLPCFSSHWRRSELISSGGLGGVGEVGGQMLRQTYCRPSRGPYEQINKSS